MKKWSLYWDSTMAIRHRFSNTAAVRCGGIPLCPLDHDETKPSRIALGAAAEECVNSRVVIGKLELCLGAARRSTIGDLSTRS